MEIITVSGPPPDDTNSPEYLEWHEREFVMRGNLVLNQSSQIEALQAHVRSLEMRVAHVVEAARGLVKPPKPLELVEDKNQDELPEPALRFCKECGQAHCGNLGGPCVNSPHCDDNEGAACYWVEGGICKHCRASFVSLPEPEPVALPEPVVEDECPPQDEGRTDPAGDDRPF